MIAKTILSPQFSVMLPTSLIATFLPPFSQCGQLPFLNFFFSPIFFWRKEGLRQDLTLLPKVAWNSIWSQHYESQSLQIHSNPLAPAFAVLGFQAGTTLASLCFNHPLALLQWSKKVLQGTEVSLGSVLSGLLPGHPQVPWGHNLFLIAFYIFFLLFGVTGILDMHV